MAANLRHQDCIDPSSATAGERTATPAARVDATPKPTLVDATGKPVARIDPVAKVRPALPFLSADGVTVRGLMTEDAEPFFSLLSAEPVTRFLMPPPGSVERFSKFIEWARTQEQTGKQLCFALVPGQTGAAAGLIQVRQVEPGFAIAEWGFAVGHQFWGTGLFRVGAKLVLDYLFQTVGVRRLEARTIVNNARANKVLEKMGATREGVLRKGFYCNGVAHDQVLWSILADEWDPHAIPSPNFH
jgi:ribosomal-protein-alanine N-acetyltransferase